MAAALLLRWRVDLTPAKEEPAIATDAHARRQFERAGAADTAFVETLLPRLTPQTTLWCPV